MSATLSSRPTVSLVRGAVAGLVAGIVMAMVAMMAAAAMGMGFFAPLAMIGAIILGPDAVMHPTGVELVAGLFLHMMLSMMFGVIFAAIVARIRGSYLALGAAYGIALWLVNFSVLSFVSAGGRMMATHEPPALAVGTHLVFGLVLGAIVARQAVRAS